MSRRKSIDRQAGGPLHVVDQHAVTLADVDEPGDLLADPLDVVRDLLGAEQRSLAGPPARIADEAGRAAGEPDRAMPGLLEPAQHDQADQVADVQARRGRVAAVVQRHRPGLELRTQRLEVGRVRDQAAPGKLIEDVGGHRTILPHAARVDARRTACRAESVTSALRELARNGDTRRGRGATRHVGSPSIQSATAVDRLRDPDPRATANHASVDRRYRRGPARRARLRHVQRRSAHGRSPAPGSAGPVRARGRAAVDRGRRSARELDARTPPRRPAAARRPRPRAVHTPG